MPRFGPCVSRVSDPGSPTRIVSPRLAGGLAGSLRTTTSEDESRWKNRSGSLISMETPAPLPCAPNRTLLPQTAAVTARMKTFSSTPPGAAMVAEGLERTAFATISDPVSVELAAKAGIGAKIRLSLGGKGAPDLTPPLEVEAEVINLTDGEFICAGPMWQGVTFSMGATAVVRIGGIDVIVSSVPTAVMDLNVFRSAGINPQEKTTIGLKSRNHFKAAYGPIARETLLVDAGGIASMRLHELTYRNIPRPIRPLENSDLVKDLLTMQP